MPVLPPAVAAGLATTFELGCSTLVIIGLATRLATLPLLAMIGTIQCFVYPSAWPEHLVWSIDPALPADPGGGGDLDRPPDRGSAERAGLPTPRLFTSAGRRGMTDGYFLTRTTQSFRGTVPSLRAS